VTLMQKHFTSPREYAKWLRTHPTGLGDHLVGVGKLPSYAYYGGAEAKINTRALQGVELLDKGSEKHVPEARKLLSKLMLQVETPTKAWRHDVVGYFPDVPTALAGDPEAMWIQDTTTHDRSPLRVWLGVTSDWSITEDQLRRRGIALAAFAIAMSEVRPVIITCWINRGEYASDNVYGYRRRSPAPAPVSLKGALISWDIKSSPLVLAQLLASTADPLITRHVGLPACTLLNPELTHPGAPFHPYQYAKNHAAMRAALGCASADLYLPMIERDDPLLSDPVGWVRTNVAHYSNPDQEDNY
jgi:hypothetical protein